MFRVLALAVLVAATGFGTASAVTFRTTLNNDAEFRTECSQGTGINDFCEGAVGEIRYGRPGNGDWEFSINDGSNSVGAPQAQAAWTSGQDRAFRYSHNGSGTFRLQLFDTDPSNDNDASATTDPVLTRVFPETDLNRLYIRTRGVNANNRVELRNLVFAPDGASPIDVSSGAGLPVLGNRFFGIDIAEYIVLENLDLTGSWVLSGFVRFTFDGVTDVRGSRLNVNFKTAFFEATPVPLPAAAWMLLTALGGLAGLRALRRAPSGA